MLKLTSYAMAGWMLIGSLFPRTDFSQLLRLRSLVDHYQLHQIEAQEGGRAYGWADFLWQHFWDCDSHQHPDQSAHDELPCHQSFVASVQMWLEDFSSGWSMDLDLMVRKRAFFTPTYISLELAFEFFHPPALI